MKWLILGLGMFILMMGCIADSRVSTLQNKPDAIAGISPALENKMEENPVDAIEEEMPPQAAPEQFEVPTIPAANPNAKPALYNLGVNFGPLNQQTKKAGDFLFRQGLFDDKIFLESGALVNGSNGLKRIPELTYHLPEGTKIFSPVNGTVSSIQEMYSGDYAVNIKTTPESQWLVTFEHLENIIVQEGQTVQAGTIIGDASTWGGVDGMAFAELVVWKGGATENDIIKVCPVTLLDPSVKADFEAKLEQLAEEWESYRRKDIYDEEEWFAPGCIKEQMTEYEAMNP